MAEGKKSVTLVRYVFSANDLLSASESDLNRYQIDESILKYIDLCESELRRAYPNAVVEVIDSDSAMSDSGTYVESWNDLQGSLASDEIARVNEICDRIFNQPTWIVLKKLLPIGEAEVRLRIPMAVLRWLCANGLFKGASRAMGPWEVLYEEVARIHELVIFLNSPAQLNTSSNLMPMACYLEDIKDIPVSRIPEQVNFLVASRNGFLSTFFESETSLCVVRREEHQAQVTLEHFVDTVPRWSGSRWSYSTYAEALRRQAERKGIECEYQVMDRKGKREIIGISFLLSVAMTQGMTFKTLVTEISGMLLEVIRGAEVALRGGPEWNAVYEKKGQELLFHEKVLKPLLERMYSEVFYTHGNRSEHGRDFVFVETTKFQEQLYCGLQAKVGDLSGGANSDIEGLLRQINRAFTMPFTRIIDKPEVYISLMIVAISGIFTQDAIDVIRKELPKHIPVGSVIFWNKERIISLIYQHWKGEND